MVELITTDLHGVVARRVPPGSVLRRLLFLIFLDYLFMNRQPLNIFFADEMEVVGSRRPDVLGK